MHPYDHPSDVRRPRVVDRVRDPIVVFVRLPVEIVLPVYRQVGRNHDEPGQPPVIEVVLFGIIADRIHPVR